MQSTASFNTAHATFFQDFETFRLKFQSEDRIHMQSLYDNVKHSNASVINFVYEMDAAGNRVLLEMRTTVRMSDLRKPPA